MSLTQPKPRLPRMTADEFLAWAEDLSDGQRYELVHGEVVAMSPERAVHARAKREVAKTFEAAIKAAGHGCEVFPDGMAVRVDTETVYEPDALVRCGEPLDDDAIEILDPVIVVEVISPTSRSRDHGVKFENYFRVLTLVHYLVVNTKSRRVVHHRRENDAGDDPQIATRILAPGSTLDLTPPGLRVEVASLFPA